MPRLDDSRESLIHTGQSVAQSFRNSWNLFQDFALRDNVLEVAVGLIIASTFTKVVSSFVTDILLPPISLLPFLSKNLDQKFAVLRHGDHQQDGNYNTLAQARDDGAVVMAYGEFLNQTLNFLGISMALFLIARGYGWAASDPIIKPQVKCKYCRKYISQKAKRCVNCTSWQDGSEESRS